MDQEIFAQGSLKLCLWPDPRLAQVANPVKAFGPRLRSLVDEMVRLMKEKKGIGLACNQVGVLERVIVIEIQPEWEDEKAVITPFHGSLIVLVNPEISLEEGRQCEKEGCLSFPSLSGEYIVRPWRVICKAQNLEGEFFTVDAQGLLAACLSHECDHLNGVTLIQRLSSLKKEKALRKLSVP